MRASFFLAGLAAVALSGAAAAQTPAGEYSGALSRMISQAAAGTCAPDVMGDQLLAACNQQITQMASGLQSLGPIESVTFLRAEDTPQGRMEFYSVRFTGGMTLTWYIGARQPDGKFQAAGTGG